MTAPAAPFPPEASQGPGGGIGARYAAAITYATVTVRLSPDDRERFAQAYARTAYPAPSAFYRSTWRTQ